MSFPACQTVVCHSGLCDDAIPYVATDLQILTPAVPLADGLDIQHGWTAYRRVDPPYYAYLYARMRLAKEATEHRIIPAPAYQHLRETFARVHGWARAWYGDMALREALTRTSVQTYPAPIVSPYTMPAVVLDEQLVPTCDLSEPMTAPRPFSYPIDGAFRFTHTVTWGAVLLVDMIRDEARRLGWSDALLYRNRSALAFPCGQEYGLVCFLGPDVAIGEVAKTSIALESTHPGGGTLRFYHPEGDHPWVIRRA